MSCVILLLMRNMVSFHKVWCDNSTLTHEALFLIPFLFNCPRCIVVLQNRGRIFAGNGCKWRGNVIELHGSNGIRRCTQVVEGSGLEIESVTFRGDLANPWYFGLLPLFYTFSKLNIYGFSTLCLRFLHLVINQPETRKALKIQHGDVSKWS